MELPDTRHPATLSSPVATHSGGDLRLDELPDRVDARVIAIDPEAAGQPLDRTNQLSALGFLPGEPIVVLRRMWPGGDPLSVRVGLTTFALRKSEACCIRVRPCAAATVGVAP